MPAALDLALAAANMLDSPAAAGSRPGQPRLPARPKGALMSTYVPKPGEIKQNWHVIDASDQVLGRMAARIAVILQGKHKPTYAPHVDTGDFVVVLNADKVRVTGSKSEVIEYDRYVRYPSGRRVWSYNTMQEKHPERLVELAVRRMLPKNKIGRVFLSKLKIYRGGEHPHAAQQPAELKI
jgi:large subunit ribosomal protein L13